MACFGMLMNSPHSEFQRISPQKRPLRQIFTFVHDYGVRSISNAEGPRATRRDVDLSPSLQSITTFQRTIEARPKHES
jgi:hypothetical protein